MTQVQRHGALHWRSHKKWKRVDQNCKRCLLKIDYSDCYKTTTRGAIKGRGVNSNWKKALEGKISFCISFCFKYKHHRSEESLNFKALRDRLIS